MTEEEHYKGSADSGDPNIKIEILKAAMSNQVKFVTLSAEFVDSVIEALEELESVTGQYGIMWEMAAGDDA